MIVLLALAACGEGPSDESLIANLQVVSVVAEPPEVGPGEAVTLTATVADPAAIAPEVLVWTCTSLGEGCLEHQAPGFGTTLGALTDGQMVVERSVPVELAAVFAKDPTLVLPVFAWTLACAPGTCPLIDAVRADPAPGSAEGDALAEALTDPTAAMADLPLESASLTAQFVSVSVRPAEERVKNPVIATAPEGPVTGDPAEVVPLGFTVESDDTVTAWGYGTAGGGFRMATVEVEDDGTLEMEAVLPDPAAAGEAYVVFVGELGGQAVWRAPLTSDGS